MENYKIQVKLNLFAIFPDNKNLFKTEKIIKTVLLLNF